MSAELAASDGEQDGKTDATPADALSIAKDDAFHILQNARRRAVLRYLLEHDDRDQFRMRDLAEEVAAWEHDTTVQQLSSTQRQRVYIALYQSHLPKLDDHGVLEYNKSRGTIVPSPLLYAFAPYLDEGLHTDSDELTIPESELSANRLSATVNSLFSR